VDEDLNWNRSEWILFTYNTTHTATGCSSNWYTDTNRSTYCINETT